MFIEPEHLDIVKKILKKHVPNTEVWAFGSRVHGDRIKKFSDFDLAIVSEEKNLSGIIYNLKEEFIESELPFKVDVIDFLSASDEFKNIIKKKYEIIQSVN